MFDIGRLKDGDTVVISGAAGSVGLVRLVLSLHLLLSFNDLIRMFLVIHRSPLRLPSPIPSAESWRSPDHRINAKVLRRWDVT